jgi:hypothetical protein
VDSTLCLASRHNDLLELHILQPAIAQPFPHGIDSSSVAGGEGGLQQDADIRRLLLYLDKIAYGGYLAGFGHCVRCHTPPGDGKPFNMNLAFAGGREFPSFGQIPASVSRNITPDPDDGIGKWSYDGRSPI